MYARVETGGSGGLVHVGEEGALVVLRDHARLGQTVVRVEARAELQHSLAHRAGARELSEKKVSPVCMCWWCVYVSVSYWESIWRNAVEPELAMQLRNSIVRFSIGTRHFRAGRSRGRENVRYRMIEMLRGIEQPWCERLIRDRVTVCVCMCSTYPGNNSSPQ